jgi:PAS domain S-box-containing protein
MAALWINYELARSDSESLRFTTEYFNTAETTLSQETNRISEYIEAQTSASQVKFFVNIKNQVQGIWNMLEGLDLDHSSDFKSQKDKELILTLLNHFSYNGGRSSFFFFSSDGQLLFSDSSSASKNHPESIKEQFHFDSNELQAALKSVKEAGEGFYRLVPMTSQGPGRAGEIPTTFLKYHRGFEWVIGISEYYSDFSKDLGKELITWADNIPLPVNENLLIIDEDGTVLSFGDPELVGLNVLTDPKASSLKDVGAKVLDQLKRRSKNIFRFTFANDQDDQKIECIAYYRSPASWNWVIINWITSESLEQALIDQQAIRDANLDRQIFRVVLISLAMLLIIIFISKIIFNKAGAGFQAFFNFFEKAATSSVEMDPASQQFAEFGQLALAANSMIHKRREIERQLVESELKFRTIFEVTPQIIIIMDSSGRLLEANSQFNNYAVCSVEEARGCPLHEVLDMGSKAWKKIISHLASDTKLAGEEIKVTNSSNQTAYLLLFGGPLFIRGQKYLLTICIDITERKKAETEKVQLQEKLAVSQKKEALGMMAASMAHELNNILSGLIGYPELMLRDGGLAPAQEAQIMEILDAGQRASMVVGDFMTLSKGVATSKVAVDVNDLVRKSLESSTIRLLLNSIKGKVDIDADLSKEAAVTKGSPVHMRKVVLNLLVNAIEAVGGNKGDKHVSITTKNVKLEENPGAMENFKPGNFVEISVSDNGPGISEEIMGHIFEPFYSKALGAHRGLGLAIVDLAAKEHGGAVKVSTSESGSVFTVYLPSAEGAKPQVDRARVLADFKGQGERILVVDDMDIQRKLAKKMLKTLGYEPYCVASGEEAVEYLRQSEADLIILDMIMDPGINGRQTYEAILAFKPHQKAIIASGMAENEEVEKAQALGASHFVSKPYTLEDIAGAIHQALNADAP